MIGGGGGSVTPYVYVMPTAQTSATINHTLGRDPIAVQVFDETGVLCEGYSVAFTVPTTQVQVGFDISMAATIRLL